MNKISLEKKILAKIKQNNIRPKPKVFFVLKNSFFWFLSILFVILGGISFALILYKISGNYQTFLQLLENLNFSESVIYLMPLFWIIFLVIFLFLAIFNYKQTKLFYRVNSYLVLLIFFLLSFILGTIFFYTGIAQKTEEISQQYLPFYNKYQKIQEVKKRIFVERLKNLGITQDVLNNNSDLKWEIEKRFDKNVLGKNYLYRYPDECLIDTFICREDQFFFEDSKGCGCRDIYYNLQGKK